MLKIPNWPYYIKPIRFLLLGIAMYIAWVFLYELVIKPSGWIDPWLTRHLALASQWILSAVGIDVENQIIDRGNLILSQAGRTLVHIDYVCDGLELYVIFLIFIVAFPGPWKKKLWFIPTGFLVIFLVNLLRVVGLIMISIHSPSSLAFNHKYTFTMLVYAVIFGLWYFWVRKFSVKTSTHE